MLTKAQQVMVNDGFPPSLFWTQEERKAAWDAAPPKPYSFNNEDDAAVIQRKQMREALEQEAIRIRNLRFAALKAKKVRAEMDVRGMRWSSRTNKWEPDPNSQEYIQMGKWTVTPYNAEGEVIQRGITSIADGSGEVAVFGKMGAAYHRCAAGSVHKIIVTNEAGETLREWEEGGAILPKPVPSEKAPSLDKTIKKAKAKGAAKAAKAVAKAKPAKAAAVKNSEKGPGVIATIVATISRSQGASAEEGLAVLTKTFPQREPKGMLSTFRIQANRHCTKKDKDEKRGLVYYKTK